MCSPCLAFLSTKTSKMLLLCAFTLTLTDECTKAGTTGKRTTPCQCLSMATQIWIFSCSGKCSYKFDASQDPDAEFANSPQCLLSSRILNTTDVVGIVTGLGESACPFPLLHYFNFDIITYINLINLIFRMWGHHRGLHLR